MMKEEYRFKSGEYDYFVEIDREKFTITIIDGDFNKIMLPLVVLDDIMSKFRTKEE